MRASKTVAVFVASVTAVFAFAAPASATTTRIYGSGGDYAEWNSDSNYLTVCDSSSGNGTAKAVLSVTGGNTWQKFDDNGANAGCGVAGPLSVDDTKTGTLYICTTNSGPCWSTPVHM